MPAFARQRMADSSATPKPQAQTSRTDALMSERPRAAGCSANPISPRPSPLIRSDTVPQNWRTPSRSAATTQEAWLPSCQPEAITAQKLACMAQLVAARRVGHVRGPADRLRIPALLDQARQIGLGRRAEHDTGGRVQQGRHPVGEGPRDRGRPCGGRIHPFIQSIGWPEDKCDSLR